MTPTCEFVLFMQRLLLDETPRSEAFRAGWQSYGRVLAARGRR